MVGAVFTREMMSNRSCLFAVVLLSCALREILGAINAACVQRTVDHHCCRFPFYYKGIKYRSCTYHGDINNHFWCATEEFKYSRNVSESWGYCKLTDSQCFVETTDGDCCLFPFKYRGKEYKNCAPTEGNRGGAFWCATRSEFDKSINGSGWGYCAGSACYTCRSSISWDDCNENMVENICPYRYEPFCVTYSREQSANNSKLFVKDCASENECYKTSCNKQGSLSGSCSRECCHGDLCNTGESAMANSHGSLALLLAVMLTVDFFPHG